jgi:flavin reductase (DIM6/NTAB) family NADH-FMN oxidoreductase RutF
LEEKPLAKVKLNPQPLLFPVPSVLVGANVGGKPNFMTAAWCGVACSDPPMLSVALQRSRYTYKGIRENMSFSINVPSVDQVKETDYCGMKNGAEVDKVSVCRFKIFYAGLKTAPLIEQCPVNLECKVVHILDLGSHMLIVGKIEETFVSEECLTANRPDVNKIKPFAFAMGSEAQYRGMGEIIGKPFNVGLDLNNQR